MKEKRFSTLLKPPRKLNIPPKFYVILLSLSNDDVVFGFFPMTAIHIINVAAVATTTTTITPIKSISCNLNTEKNTSSCQSTHLSLKYV